MRNCACEKPNSLLHVMVTHSAWGNAAGTPPSDAMAVISDGDWNRHACGLTASTGAALCWGPANDPSCGQKDVPAGGASYVQVSVGQVSSCALLGSDATAVCWGCSCSGSEVQGQCTVRYDI